MAGTSCATLGPAPAPQNSTNQQAKLNKTSIVRFERVQISSDYPMAREHSRAFELVLGADTTGKTHIRPQPLVSVTPLAGTTVQI